MDAGAAAVMVAPVPTLKTEPQIINYFDQVVEALGTDVPWILQDYPLTIPVHFTPDVLRRIINAHQSCVVFKHEDWPGLEKLTALKKFMAAGSMRRIPIFCGQGGLFLDHELERGAEGSMTGYAFPELLVRAQQLHADGRRDEFRDLFDIHLPYLRYENQLGLGVAARKYILKKRGALLHETMRKPFMALSETGKAEMDYLVERLLRKDPLPFRVVQ
jgi:4-hydroxy-tetrahydrodipicolinate synthase